MATLNESTVEDAALGWLEELGWQVAHGPDIAPDTLNAERGDYGEVVLERRLRETLARLNPDLPASALQDAYRKLTQPEGATLEAQNRAFHRLLVDGVTVEYRTESGAIRGKQAKVIEFGDPEKNDWLAVNQFTVVENKNNRRPDVVLFINGLPLGVIELKNAASEDATIWTGFHQLQTYKAQLPSLFALNELLMISDGTEARVGTLTAGREWFKPWRTISGKDLADPGMTELQVAIEGLLDRQRLLAFLRDFIVFDDEGGGKLIKKMAGYHQFHAVQQAIGETLRAVELQREVGVAAEPPGRYETGFQPGGEPGDRRIGVVWHTQGSGKSLTMAFYAGRIAREPAMENPTIVVLTDRNDLDDQLFSTFSRCSDLLHQSPVKAESRADLRRKLAVASGGVVFTTIQKFLRPEPSPGPLDHPLPPGEGLGEHYRGGRSFLTLIEQARELRQKQTPAEELLWQLLRNRQLAGAKFRRQHQFGPYICDFYCHEAKLVVECDGKVHNDPEQREKDRARDANMRAEGLTVLRFWNDDVLNDTERVLTSIEDHLPLSPWERGPGGKGLQANRTGRRQGREGSQAIQDEGSKDNNNPVSDRRNIVVIADEAHRSQYDFIDGFARHMRDALPHASFIGFTGTPIVKTDANTRAVFGDYISIYDIQKAVEDGATVPIYYESRLAQLELDESAKPRIDPDFEEVTEGEEAERKEKMKTKWAQLEAIVGTDKRLELVARDIVEHYETRCETLEGKAMIVGMSRRICVDLYEKITALRPEWHGEDDDEGQIKVVMTGSASDPVHWQQHIRNKKRREALANRFRDPADPFRVVIVCDMWLTGFDAPSLHTMYIDKPMRGHGLMQAIARVNRVFRDKPGGLVVDYIGLAPELKKALATYTESGGTGETVLDQSEAVAVMREKYEICCDMLHGFDWSPWVTGTPQERLTLLPAAQEHILAQENGKERFVEVVRDLSKAFALSVPHDATKEIRDDVAFFQAVQAGLSKRAPSDARPEEELDQAVRQIISRAMSTDGVVDIFDAAGLEKPDVSILSDEFLAEVRGMPQRNLAVETLQKLLKGEIKTKRKKNVVQARSFAEMLEKTLRKYQNRAIEAAQVIEELIALAKDMREADQRGEDLGLSDDELAFYDALETNDSAVAVLGDETLRGIARELVETVRNNVTIDWTVRENVRAQLRVLVKRILRKHGYPPDKQEKATQTVLEQAEQLSQEWVAG